MVHPAITIYGEIPFNAGTPPELLRQSFITPTDLFFARNHGTTPEVDVEHYRLSVGGAVAAPLEWSLDELRTRFAKHTVTAALQCAGNRRKELMDIRPIPDEIAWDLDAVGSAVWGGVRLCDVLREAGVQPEARHVAAIGLDEVEQEGRGFGGSIPLDKAMCDEVLLAYEMNGAPLTCVHGFPLRLIVPGYIGARSVKWLSRLTLQTEPSDNYFQAHAYKLFSPDIDEHTVDWDRGQMLAKLPLNAVILQPLTGEHVSAGHVLVRGFALDDGEHAIEKVEVCTGGRWTTAQFVGETHPFAWRWWEVQIELAPGVHEIAARAWNSLGETQPASLGETWNFKGYANNAWHRIQVRAL